MKHYTWIGDDHPVGWRRVGTIDVADPADVHTARDRGYRVGGVYEGGSGSVAEPCAADTYVDTHGLRWERQPSGQAWSAYSGLLFVAMIGVGSRMLSSLHAGDQKLSSAAPSVWWVSMPGFRIGSIPGGVVTTTSEHRAKTTVEEAWAGWLEHAGLMPDPAERAR